MPNVRVRPLAIVIMLVAVAVAVAALAHAQTQDWSRPGKAFLSGENPWIFLTDKPGGTTLTQVSFWRIHWSPAGTGHVAFVTVGEDKKPGYLRIALHDNQKLLDYLTRDVLGTYNKAYLERPFTPVKATCTAGGDAIAEHRETCKSAEYTVELKWQELRTPALNDIKAGARTTNPFGITWLQIPAGRAEVIINGNPSPGSSVPGESFLAFGETWIK